MPDIKVTREALLRAAGRATVFEELARKAGRTQDADDLAVMGWACRQEAEWADDARTLGAAAPVPAGPAAVCCLCDGEGRESAAGWTCPNRRCPRFGVPLPRETFEGQRGGGGKTRQDRAGEAVDAAPCRDTP